MTSVCLNVSLREFRLSIIPKRFMVPKYVDIFHITSGVTIYVTEIKDDKSYCAPVVCDISSYLSFSSC